MGSTILESSIKTYARIIDSGKIKKEILFLFFSNGKTEIWDWEGTGKRLGRDWELCEIIDLNGY